MRSSNVAVASKTPILGPGSSGRLAQLEVAALGRFDQRPGDRLDHEAVRRLGERKGARFAGGADDAARGAGEADQVIGLAAAGAGGQLRREAGGEGEPEPEGERRVQRGGGGGRRGGGRGGGGAEEGV